MYNIMYRKCKYSVIYPYLARISKQLISFSCNAYISLKRTSSIQKSSTTPSSVAVGNSRQVFFKLIIFFFISRFKDTIRIMIHFINVVDIIVK